MRLTAGRGVIELLRGREAEEVVRLVALIHMLHLVILSI